MKPPRLDIRGTLAALALLAGPVHAQLDQNQRKPYEEHGFSADKAYAVGGVESLSMLGGSLALTIPIGGSYSLGGGFSYGLTLVYNSTVWDFVTSIDGNGVPQVDASPARFSNAGLGWQLHLGKLLPPSDLATPNDNRSTEHWLFVGPDGGEHFLYSTLHHHEAETGEEIRFSRDGSYLRLRRGAHQLAGGGSEDSYCVEHPDGSARRFLAPCDTQECLLRGIVSPFGDEVLVDVQAGQTTLADPHGRSHRILIDPVLGYVDRVELAAFDGETATYELDYQVYAVHVSCKDTFGDDLGDELVFAPLLTSIELPDGSSWRMDYNQDGAGYCDAARVAGVSDYCSPGDPGADDGLPVRDRPGTIKQLVLPAGGIYEWTTPRRA